MCGAVEQTIGNSERRARSPRPPYPCEKRYEDRMERALEATHRVAIGIPDDVQRRH